MPGDIVEVPIGSLVEIIWIVLDAYGGDDSQSTYCNPLGGIGTTVEPKDALVVGVDLLWGEDVKQLPTGAKEALHSIARELWAWDDHANQMGRVSR